MAAVMQPPSVSAPFPMSHPRVPNSVPSSSSRHPQQSHPPPPPTPVPDQPRPMSRLRSLEQSIRSATRSKKQLAPATDEFATMKKVSRGREKAEAVEKEKDKSPGMLRRLESQLNFRRGGRESSSPIPPSESSSSGVRRDNSRVAGFTSFITPSLRQGSISSPALHLSSQAIPSPRSKPAIPASSSSSSAALVSPPRERTRKVTLQTPPTPSHKRDSAPVPARATSTSKHRSTKSQPINALASTEQDFDRPSPPSTPTRSSEQEIPSPPATPTPHSRSYGQLARHTSKASSSSHLPMSSPPASPISPRNASPIRPRSPSSRTRPTRGLSSSSSSNLPLTTSTPLGTPATPRRPSIDAGRRPSDGSPRRPSVDSPRRASSSLARDRNETPSPSHPRPRSPAQRGYSQNRHVNMSSISLSAPHNAEHRDLIRTASSMLCKETLRPPPHLARSKADWEGVELRMQSLVRLERIWGKSGPAASSNNVMSGSNMSSTGLSAGGEERERRLFCEALRDGYVLCQLLNKLRSSSVVKPDPKEDGFSRTSNITKFLAGCSSWGLPNEDLFQHDDLIEATGESLARVARTIIAVIKFVDAPTTVRSRFLSGQGQPTGPQVPAKKSSSTPGPYGQSTHHNASASSPNLHLKRTISPIPPSPSKISWSPSQLPTVRSNSPDETVRKTKGNAQCPTQEANHVDNDRAVKETPKIKPPPRSPLRSRPSPSAIDDDGQGLFTWAVKKPNLPSRNSVADSTRASLGDASFRDSISDPIPIGIRQSVASAVTDTTTTTSTSMISSLLDVGRSTSSNAFNKFGTIRTMTTEATSESPSISLTEGSFLSEDSGFKRGDYKFNDSVVDLSRVVEETDTEGSQHIRNGRSQGNKRPPAERDNSDRPGRPALRLGKGKWPDDFLDAVQAHNRPQDSPTEQDDSSSPVPTTSSGPKKLAVVGGGRRNEPLDGLPQFPRRPSHRARHSIDATPSSLLPKDPSYRRDASPDSVPSRVIVRRQSTKPPNRSNSLLRSSTDDPRLSEPSDAPVPFPRTASGDHTPTNHSSSDETDKVRPIRGRFQSDVEGSFRRPRPSSYDEFGAKPMRGRFESMVNLGGPSSNASASDLLSRDSTDGSARPILIVREEGKPPTKFQLGNCIGRGQFGSVYRALNQNTGQMVAVKRIRLEGLKEDEVTTLMREVDLVKSLSHPSIVKYEGMARDADSLSIVLEYAENGSLGQTLKSFGKLNERLVASYVVKILEGLHYLHGCDVVHCDLKAANILTTKNGNVKLSDFGVSLNLRAVERDIKDVAGTPNWMAPEVIELKGASPKSDIWSLGCTVIELLTGRPPYGEISNSMTVMFRIVEDDCPPIPDGCSPLLVDFLLKCFDKEPSKRPTAELLCEHPWLKKNWGLHKELRPQDSIPFLRRVSADLNKSDAVRIFAQFDLPESPTVDQTPTPRNEDFIVPGSPTNHRRMSNSSQRPLAESDILPREHNFVKTTFSKPMTCKVCLLSVKKNAVLCADCSLICHSKCTPHAPPTCDLRAQLLLYAQYAEKGNPASAYSNPLEHHNTAFPKSPMSDVSYVEHTPRTSIDLPPQPSLNHTPLSPAHPPTAFKLMSPFKRGRTVVSPEPGQSSTSLPSSQVSEPTPKPKVVLRKERPQSMSSNGTHGTSSTMRSSSTTGGSTGARSRNGGDGLTAIGEDGARPSARSDVSQDGRIPTHWEMPGGDISAPEQRRHRKNKSSANCTVQ